MPVTVNVDTARLVTAYVPPKRKTPLIDKATEWGRFLWRPMSFKDQAQFIRHLTFQGLKHKAAT